MQHLNRLRRELITEGHLVPPSAQRTAGANDPNIRGYIRQDMEGDDKEAVRPVNFDEKFEDARFNLPGSYEQDDDDDNDEALGHQAAAARSVSDGSNDDG